MASYNLWVGLGNATRDAELKYLPSGSAVCEIDLAINDSYFNKQTNQKVESVSFVTCVFYGKIAEVCGQYVTRGKQLLVQGKLKQQSWTDKETQAKRSKLIVVAESMQLLGGKSDQRPDTRNEPASERKQAPESEPAYTAAGDDVPF
jgi:single-strand DNA-binding protein